MEILRIGGDLDSFFVKLKQAEKSVLFLDYDGTLAPFRKERDSAFPYPGVRELLDNIIENNCCRVVLISGRGIEDLIPLLGLKRLPEIWGSHGWERLKADNVYETLELSAKSAGGLADAYNWCEEQGLLIHCEKKTASLALHWRGLNDDVIKQLNHKLLGNWSPIAKRSGLVLHKFNGGLELRIPGRNKGDAVRAVLAEEAAGVAAAYLGDDLTDEDAFSALRGQGLNILVRSEPRPTSADIRLQPPEELLAFLNDWALACGLGRTSVVR